MRCFPKNIPYLRREQSKNTVMNANMLLSLPGGWEWVLIVVVVVLLFGGKKIPELMKGLGRGVKEFKEGMKDDANDTSEQDNRLDRHS